MADENLNPTNTDLAQEASGRHTLLVFWLRMLGWIGTGVVAPISTFAIKFGLFQEYGYGITTDELGNVTGMHVALNGWGILSVVLVFLAVSSILNEVILAQGKGYSYSKQILTGLRAKILPLAVMLGVAFWLNGVIEQIQFCLIILMISQTAAMAINPMPQWRARKTGDEDYSDLLSSAVKALKEFNRKEGNK